MKRAEIHGVVVYDNGEIYECKDGIEIPKKHSNGKYYIVKLDNKAFPIHRLVAEAFIPNPNNKPYVNHKDGNTHNNCASNLEWVTSSENTKHAWSTGLIKRRHITQRKLAEWREYQASKNVGLRSLRKRAGLTQAQAAQNLGIGQSTLARYERGALRLPTDRLSLMCEVFDCTIEQILEALTAQGKTG